MHYTNPITFLFFVFVLCSWIPTNGQDSINRPAELPPGSVRIPKEVKVDDADARLLTAVYSTIGYPRIAREAGVMGAVSVHLHIDSLGELTVRRAEFYTPEEASPRLSRLRSEQVIGVVAYSIPKGPVPALTKSLKRRARAQAALVDEVTRTFLTLPQFAPAVRDGRAVPSDVLYVITFKLE